MKKKLLSLVLAGAMVASTSVSAFADQNSVTGDHGGVAAGGQVESVAGEQVESVAGGKIDGPDNKQYSTEVKIKGDVEDNKGQTKPGTLSVTVATAASFKVDQHGKLIGSNIAVNNQGTDDIDVFAYKFIDTTPSTDIIVEGKSGLASNRTHVALNINGGLATAYLGSDSGNNNGIYKDEDLTSQEKNTPIRIATVAPGGIKNLELSGEVASDAPGVATPVSDRFTLVLKIAKTDKSNK